MRKTVDFIELSFSLIRKKLVEYLTSLDKDTLYYSPEPGIHSPIRLFLHVIQVEEFWLKSTLIGEKFEFGMAVDWKDTSVRLDIDEVLKYAKDVRRRFNDYLEGLSDEDLENSVSMHESGTKEPVSWVLYNILEHECMHAGQIRMIVALAGKELPTGPLLFEK